MIELIIKGFASTYEIEHLARLFYPAAPLRATASSRGHVLYVHAGNGKVVTALRTEQGVVCLQQVAYSLPVEQPAQAQKEILKKACRQLYDLLVQVTGTRPAWGMLTGVRPVRLLRRHMQQGPAFAHEQMQGYYDVSNAKYSLAQGIVQRQAPILQANTLKSYSLYISIPFCPSRCSYCSFVSRTLQQDSQLVDVYLQYLKEELACIATLAAENALQLETVYIGGGTPTALNAQQLRFLLQVLQDLFTPASTHEYTVEAGRPDCTDAEKLALLKEYGVTRISINPQSLQPQVLAAIGRHHTADDFFRCFEQARKAGHKSINTDVIAGLPKDDLTGFADTLQQLLALQPENITVHTLTLKRASNLVIDRLQSTISLPGMMLESAYPVLLQSGYSPYYLYRQKSGVDNLENTGWAKPGEEGLYNIYIMEEAHTILAAGAGASTKLVAQKQGVIQRQYNHKYATDYINNHQELLIRKRGVTEFYARYLDTETLG